jgi:hypothetical protein
LALRYQRQPGEAQRDRHPSRSFVRSQLPDVDSPSEQAASGAAARLRLPAAEAMGNLEAEAARRGITPALPPRNIWQSGGFRHS